VREWTIRRGRKPQPTKLLRLRGAYRHDRHGNRLDPLPTGPLLEPPDWLTDAQRQRFHEILANAPKNLLRSWDGPTVAGFVVAESVVMEANKARAEGHLLDSARGGVPTVAALLKVQSRFLPLMKQFGELLGFSPVARSILKIENTAEERDDPASARWEWIKLASRTYPEGSPEAEARRQRLDYLNELMYGKPKPAGSRRKRAEAKLAEVEPTTEQPS
jgi:phage terminase small subunit